MTDVEDLVAAAEVRRNAGDFDGALKILDTALLKNPELRSGLIARANLLIAIDPSAAAAAAERVCLTSPDDPDALSLLGRARSAAGQSLQAIAAFEAAARARPGDGRALSNLSVARLRSGDASGARRAAELAIDAAPLLSEAHAALGHALSRLGTSDAALSAYQTALALRPQNADVLVGIARVFRGLGQSSTAALALLRAAKLAPSWVSPLVELAAAYRELAEFDLAMEASRRAVELAPGLSEFHSNLLLDYEYRPDIDEAQATEEARSWGIRQVAAVGAVEQPPQPTPPDPAKRMRIGYVSADLYRHPVGWLGGSVIAAHDKTACHVTIYAQQTISDALTQQLQAAVDAWVSIAGLDDDTVAKRIASDQIDVLVDLSGHTAGNRLAVFARRPAPVQVSWLGYFATTGLPTMDAIIFDVDHIIDGAMENFTERVVQLRRIRFGYYPPEYAPPVGSPPALSNGYVTFGSFNNVAKINPSVVALWARVLSSVHSSRLLLKWRSLADRFLQQKLLAGFAANGIASDRIRFDGASQHAEMLGQYGEIDIALDPFPFSGGLTTCEALWMGVPVVTLPGRRAVSRQTHAILRAIGRSDWSASNPDEYVAIASELASDHKNLHRIRLDMREEMRASALLDNSGLARALERIYRELWQSALRDQ